MKLRLCMLLVLLVAGIASVWAQEQVGPLSGRVFDEQAEGQIDHRRPGMVGAVVAVISPRDTLHTTTDYSGNFFLKQVPAGYVRVEVSFLGYETYVQDSVRVAPRYGVQRPLRIQMKAAAREIDQVVVEGRARLVSQRGDTLVYNAAAVRTLQGDEVIQMLDQLPGVEVDDGGNVTIQGEKLSRVYVNGRTIFGESPSTALNALLASDVSHLEIYDEATDDEIRQHRRFAEKQKVMNIRTKRDFKSMFDGFFLGAWGLDMNREADGSLRHRYGVGLTANLFSEKLQLTVDGYSNNIGRTSNRLRDVLSNRVAAGSYVEQHRASISMSRLWGKNRREGQVLDLSYAYDNNYTHSGAATQRNYFATEASPARLYADTTSSHSSGGTHTVKLYGLIHPGGRHQFSSRNEFSYSTPSSGSAQQILNRSETLDQRTEVLQHSESHGYTLKNNLNYQWDNPRVVRPYMSLNSTISRTDRVGWRVDTLTQDKRVLETDYVGPRESYNAEFSLQKDIYETEGMRVELFASYQWDYEHNRTRQMALNTFDPVVEIDPTNTYNYTHNYTTHSGRFAFRLNSSLFRLNAILDVRSARMNKDEYYPEELQYREKFLSWLPSLQFTLVRHGRRINIFNYSTSATLPSVEQLRDRIDNSNPMLLQTGNPALKQGIQHRFSINYPGNVNVDNGRNFTVGMNATLSPDQITQRSYYYDEATYLEKWDYTAPAGSTLYTYENISGAFSLSAYTDFSQRIAALRSTFRASLRYQFNQRPTYIEDAKNISRQHQPMLALTFSGAQSDYLRLGLHSTTSYSEVQNSIGTDNRYLYQTASVMAEVRFLKVGMLMANYNLAHCHYLTDTGTDTTTQMLNIMVGCSLSKGRVLVGVTAYDLLNRGSNFTTTTYADYELQSWKPSYGRYFALNVGVRLNKASQREFGRGGGYGGRMR
ncbi:MAG: TonB-dependent receptor [Alistipes sp.]|nr:TonB-dependent receptor [Alistipes sp.]